MGENRHARRRTGVRLEHTPRKSTGQVDCFVQNGTDKFYVIGTIDISGNKKHVTLIVRNVLSARRNRLTIPPLRGSLFVAIPGCWGVGDPHGYRPWGSARISALFWMALVVELAPLPYDDPGLLGQV